MFYLIGDFVRNGDSKDPEHSVLVSVLKPTDTAFVSMNRIGRKLHMHVWRFKHKQEQQGELEHIHSEPYSPLWVRFNKIEADIEEELYNASKYL